MVQSRNNFFFLLLFFTGSSIGSKTDQFYNNCQNSEEFGCFTFPDGCAKTKNCTLGSTWKGTSAEIYQFQLISSSTKATDYSALGFPSIQAMGPAPVIACSSNFSQPGVYFNNAKYDSSPVVNSSALVTSYSVVIEEDATSCEFAMNSSFEVAPNSSVVLSYDLNVNSSYLIMAEGPVKNGKIGYHDQKKDSPSLVDLTLHNDFYQKNDTNSKTDQFYNNCQNSEEFGCFTFPDGCAKTKNCTLGSTWKGTSAEIYQFQLISSSTKATDYSALGFPSIQAMGPAPVIACSSNFSQPGVYFNNAKYDSSPVVNSSALVTSYSVVIEEDATSCEFAMNSSFEIAPNDSVVLSYDLNVNSSYLIMAEGPVKNGKISYHDQRKDSPSLVDLTLHNNFYQKNNTNNNTNSNAIYDECYQTKGCFGQPDDCVQKRNCDMIITYTKEISVSREKGERFKFEVGGAIGPNYIALGLSSDNQMGEDSVMACVHEAGRSPDIKMYWNVGHSTSLPLPDPHQGLSDISGTAEEDFFSCTFYRDTLTNITVPGGNKTTTFDLEHSQYYLLLAKGPTSNNVIQQHVATGVSSDSVDLTSFSHVSGAKNIAVKVHASFMVLAWIFCANLGTFCARYCKDIFMGKKLYGADVWFRVHQASMMMAVIFSLAGIIPILIDKGLAPITSKKYHPVVGLTVLIIAFLQPIMAYFRPGKDHKLRPAFKYVHTGLGYVSIILATVSIFLTKELETKYLPDWGIYLMIAFSGWLVLSHLLMTGYACVKDGEVKAGFQDDPVVKTGLNVFVVGILGLCVAVIMAVILN